MRTSFLNALVNNPVLVKDIRTRMRGWRTFVLVTIHLLSIGLILGLSYMVFRSSINTSSNLQERGTFGKIMFGLVVGLDLVTISFTAPALTSGAIASERERQTYDLIKVTLLRPSALIIGKYLSGLTFILLLLFTSLPLFGPAFIIGGVLPEEIIIAMVVLLVTAIAFCAAGLFISCHISRTLFATVLSYGFAILNVFGLPMIFLFSVGLFSTMFGTAVDTPGVLTQAVLVFIGWLLVSTNPGATLIAGEAAILDGQGIWMVHFPIQNSLEITLISPWLVYVWFYTLLSAILLILSIRRVRRMEK